MNRVFVLSPANCNGLRARWILQQNSRAELAQRLRRDGAPLGEVFSFLSALYFRGKLAYAQAYADPPSNCPGIMIITPTAGLVPHDTVIRVSTLRGFSRGRIHLKSRNYCSLLQRTAKKLAIRLGGDCELVFLGSLATGKYLDILAPIYGNRLRVPETFIGLGDMSRGGLLLRCVRENQQLNYIDATTATAAKLNRCLISKQRVSGTRHSGPAPAHFLKGTRQP
jgi:hypothetical protein